jgi:hypothetical protein
MTVRLAGQLITELAQRGYVELPLERQLLVWYINAFIH